MSALTIQMASESTSFCIVFDLFSCVDVVDCTDANQIFKQTQEELDFLLMKKVKKMRCKF